MADVAILIPTYRRVERLPAVVENASHPGVAVYLIMEPNEAHDVPGAVTLTHPDGFGTYAKAIQYGYEQTSEPLLFAGADDLNFYDGWLDAARAELTGDIRVVGTNDLGNRDVLAADHATHYLVDRRYLDEVGGVFDEGPGSFLPGCYTHNWTDREFVEVAKRRGVFQPCLESVVEHMHVLWGKAPMDETYSKSFAGEDTDRGIYEARMRRVAELAHEGVL